ncbi:hypothetical protein F2P56_020145 [Juglans regia]|uniref:Cation/H(+) antiporter 1-like n=2 Tax=Juglans regia TaxID=51240 RepID=A0A833UCB5_JUGRE|nr:cation/H(+) antiporter 2-like [Juglans regia]KAF5460262.1 hypothetical protein F2P56_020145 [Juglans regia]
MDATHRMVCQEDFFNPLTSMAMQVSGILVISHFFHLVLKAFGQPGPIAQIFAGLVLGPSGLSNIPKVREFFFQSISADFYEIFGLFCRIIFMFLIGLETDIPYIKRNLRAVSALAYGGVVFGFISGLGGSFFLYRQLQERDFKFTFVFIIMLILAYTASPVVIRLAAELKFDTSDIGRMAIVSSLVNEMSCLLIFNFIVAFNSGKVLKYGSYCIFLSFSVVIINKYLANWFNKRNQNQKYLKNPEFFFILSLLVGSSMFFEWANYNSLMNCFLIGLLFPKEGKTARTLVHKLTYSVHNFILPIYFGYIGFRVNASFLNSWNNVLIVVVMVLLSVASKITGTLAACQYLQIPLKEAFLLGFLLNLKGHADLLFIGSSSKTLILWSPKAYNLLLISIVVNTIISGPIVAFLLRKDERSFGNKRTALEIIHSADEELSLLACVYGPRHMPAILSLISALSGSQKAPTNPYLMHLIELVQKRRTNVSYHELEDHELSDDEDYGGNDVLGIHDAMDAFTAETRILIHLCKAVSSFTSLYEDVCNIAEDLRVSIILLPFHKHQRIDGKMDSGKEGVRTTNQKILRHAPCSVGVIVSRGIDGVPGFSQLLGSETVQHVATLFFCGPDDREAVAWSRRIAAHPRINLTVIRFLPASSSSISSPSVYNSQKDNAADGSNAASDGVDGVLRALSRLENGNGTNEVDNVFLSDFYNRDVSSGQVAYVEKYVNNAAETVAALRDIGDLYSLFIVGKGGRGHSPLTTGICDWEECPELGTVGDLLASSDFNINGSVLVIQQHRHALKQGSYRS